MVRAVAIPGGLLQIFLFMCLSGITASVCSKCVAIELRMSHLAFCGMNHEYRVHSVDLAVSSLQLCGGKLTEGIFVGAFLSMSSTAVVYSNFLCVLLHTYVVLNALHVN